MTASGNNKVYAAVYQIFSKAHVTVQGVYTMMIFHADRNGTKN